MYLRILKKDLKHNRAMNIILLVFILLAATFVSSSANNILTVMNARDRFFEMSGMSNYFIMTKGVDAQTLDSTISGLEHYESCHIEPVIFLSKDDASVKGIDVENAPNLSLYPMEKSALNYFGTDNAPVDSVARGEILLPVKLLDNNDIEVGDTFTVTLGDVEMDFTVAGFVKDALLGSPNVGTTRVLISQEDFDRLYEAPVVEEQLRYGALASITTNESNAFSNEFMDSGISTVLMADENMVSATYILDMAVAAVLLVVSFCLVLISVVVLRFTIKFTLSRAFREIGVMKAVGISNSKIRGLYLVKYLAISLLGAALGFAAGIPFSKMMLSSVSKMMVIEGSALYFVNLLCVVLVVVVVILFCWGGTKSVKKLSPVSAVRDGSVGERFAKKSPFSLAKSNMRPVSFLAVNDIFSDLKRYLTMIIAFTLCLIMTTVVVNTINTLRSDSLVSYFGTAESDVYLVSTNYVEYFKENGRDNFRRDLEAMEETLAGEGMSGHCFGEIFAFSTIRAGENYYAGMIFQGTGTATHQYIYSEGTAPQNANEVALTTTVADALGVTIGDTVTYTDMDEQREVIVSAIFQSMMNMGNGVRLHEDAELNYTQAAGFNAYQITFDDHPDAEELERRKARLEELYPDYRILDGGEYADYFTGSADMVASVRNFLVPVMMLICMLIAMLMERSFIARETGEIAMLKATGFGRGSIVRWHTLRMGIVLLISTLLGLALSTPATQLLITPIFRMMGADSIKYDIVPVDTFVIYPALFIGATLLTVWLTAQSTGRITASQTSSIE